MTSLVQTAINYAQYLDTNGGGCLRLRFLHNALLLWVAPCVLRYLPPPISLSALMIGLYYPFPGGGCSKLIIPNLHGTTRSGILVKLIWSIFTLSCLQRNGYGERFGWRDDNNSDFYLKQSKIPAMSTRLCAGESIPNKVIFSLFTGVPGSGDSRN